MTFRYRLFAIGALAASVLTAGVVARAQNLQVEGTTTGKGNAYFLQALGVGTSSPAYKLDVAGDAAVSRMLFRGPGVDSGNGHAWYGIYQEPGAWSYPYPDLLIRYHTGISHEAYAGYGGHRFYTGYDGSGNLNQLAFSIGQYDHNVRVANNLYVGGELHVNGKPLAMAPPPSNSTQTSCEAAHGFGGYTKNLGGLEARAGVSTYKYTCGQWRGGSCSCSFSSHVWVNMATGAVVDCEVNMCSDGCNGC